MVKCSDHTNTSWELTTCPYRTQHSKSPTCGVTETGEETREGAVSKWSERDTGKVEERGEGRIILVLKNNLVLILKSGS